MHAIARRALTTLALVASPLFAGELPASTAAKFVALISRGAGENGKVQVKSPEMAAELGKAGGEAASSRVAWAASTEEVRMLAMARKCVVVGDPKALSLGAAIAVYEDGGKVKIALNQKAIQASGVTLSDAILKAAMN